MSDSNSKTRFNTRDVPINRNPNSTPPPLKPLSPINGNLDLRLQEIERILSVIEKACPPPRDSKPKPLGEKDENADG